MIIQPVLLFCGLLYTQRKYRTNAVAQLSEHYGDILHFSDVLPFSQYSKYYDEEMNGEVLREWILFKQPVTPENLYEKKLETCSIEDSMRQTGKRNVNIDPGIISLSTVQLLTTKDYAHRIYLAEGIYAEVTFMFHKNEYEYLRWTYPDYKSPQAQAFFSFARETLRGIL